MGCIRVTIERAYTYTVAPTYCATESRHAKIDWNKSTLAVDPDSLSLSLCEVLACDTNGHMTITIFAVILPKHVLKMSMIAIIGLPRLFYSAGVNK